MQLTELTNRILPIVQNSDEYVLSHQMQFLFLLAPLKKTVGIILKRLYTDKEITTTLTKRSLKKLILDTCQKAAFSFDGKMYEQIDGVSMGLSLEPVLANIIMTECERGTVNQLIENKVLQTSCGRPRLGLFNICFSYRKQERSVTQGPLLIKNNFFIKSSIFVLIGRCVSAGKESH